MSVFLPVCFYLPLASACCIQLVLTQFSFPLSLLGFPNEPAAEIALNTVKSWIEENPDKVGNSRVMHVQIKQLSLGSHLLICADTVYFVLLLICCEWGDYWITAEAQNTNSHACPYQTDMLSTCLT